MLRYIGNQVVHPTHAIRRVSVNKTHHNKTLHSAIEINQALIEALVDIKTSHISHGCVSVIRELGIMHLVAGHETCKITSRIMTHVIGRITDFQLKWEGLYVKWFS